MRRNSRDKAKLMQVKAASDDWFSPVSLAIGGRGGYNPGQLDQALWTWATSPPLRALADASAWRWPTDATALSLISRLADLSADWDFRKNRERSRIEAIPAEVNGRQIPDALVIAAARALGLVDLAPVIGREFSHMVVLSGQVAACVNRTRHAARLLRSGLRPDSVVALGAHRKLDHTEREQAEAAGLGRLADEAEVILATASQAFQLGPPQSSEEPKPGPDPGRPEIFHASSARYKWPSAEVVIAPSEMPGVRRAKTGDQLQYWAGLTDLGKKHDILIVTTQINVPYQHLVAARILGLGRGCAVYSCGADAVSLLPYVRTPAGRDYLQEIRAALRAALALLRQAHETSGKAEHDAGRHA
jgi:hypothetical protein